MRRNRVAKSLASTVSRVIFETKGFAARMGYYRRRKRRELQMYPVRWLTPESIILQDLIYVRDEDGDGAVGDRFIDVMSAARKDLADSVSRRSLLSLTIGVYIGLTILGVDFPVSLGGFELKKVPGLTEGLLVLADLIGLSAVARIVNMSVVSAALKGAIARHIDSGVRYFYRSAFLPNELPMFFQPTYLPHITWGKAKTMLGIVYVGIAITFALGILVGFVGFRLWAFNFILEHPSISQAVSVVAIAVTIALDAVSALLIWMFLLPLPHRDWQMLHEMELHDQFAPDKGQEFRRSAYREEIEDILAMERKGYMKPNDKA